MTSNADAGATPVAPGATSGQTPDSPAAGTTATTGPAATDGTPDGLGDAGKRAIDSMKVERDAAVRAQKAAEKRLAEIEESSKSDTEKALAQARKDGAAEVTARAEGAIRRSEVKAALLGAGVSPTLVALAAKADEFAALEVTEDGDVVGLAQAVEAFKRAQPALFVATGRTVGDAGLGPRGTPATADADMNTLIRRAAGRA